MMSHYVDPAVWEAVPFHFWSAVFFVFGAVVGSFLNVCIHRLPRGESLVSPPSHCPHCKYSIPWYLNIPLVTWLYLRGRCAHCRAWISSRYFVVELLTGLSFMFCWIVAGPVSPWVALLDCLFLSGLIVATFIDLEHFIIPDEITIGGIVAGVVASIAVPALHGAGSWSEGLQRSLVGMGVGAGLIYAILRLGKMLFGRQKIELSSGSKVIFTETGLVMPDREIPFEEVFYRKTDAIELQARSVELIDRCYPAVEVCLTPETLRIGQDVLDPEKIPYMEVIADELVLPREAMGFGDVKFMGAIGAFLGWQAVLFTLLASSFLGSAVGLTLILLKRQESSRLPYGPYLAAAAALWIFGGQRFVAWWWSGAWMGAF